MGESESAAQAASDRQSETPPTAPTFEACPECGAAIVWSGIGARGPYRSEVRHPADTCEAIRELRKDIKPGDTVYTKVVHVSRSGMMRAIQVYIMRTNEPRNISYRVANALGRTLWQGRDAVKVQGCGMDMTFEVVYKLGRVMFPGGFDLAPAEYARNGHGAKGGHDPDGGYALNNRGF